MQRPRRLRLGHASAARRRGATTASSIAALPNPAGRVMMLNSLAEQVRLARRLARSISAGCRRRSSRRRRAPRRSSSFALELGLPVWRFAGARHHARAPRRAVVRPEHDGDRVPPARRRPGRGSSCGRRSSSAATTSRCRRRCPRPIRCHAIGARIELDRARRRCRRCGCTSPARATSFVIEPMAVPDIAYADRGEPRLRLARHSCTRPGRFRAELAAGGERVALVASTEPWETILPISARRGDRRRGRAPPPPARRRAAAARARGPAAELVLAADQFVIRPAGRHEDHVRARDRRRRGVDGDRRLSLVHRLGPRHDDLARGPDAARPAASPRPARSCGCSRTTCATAWSRTCSPRARTRASITPPTRRCGSSTRSIATCARAAIAARSRSCCRRCATSSSTTSRGTRFGIHVDPGDGLLAPGRAPATS